MGRVYSPVKYTFGISTSNDLHVSPNGPKITRFGLIEGGIVSVEYPCTEIPFDSNAFSKARVNIL